MTPIYLSLQDFFLTLLIGGLLLLVSVMIPVQIASKVRRINRKRTHATCRICGFRFLRPEEKGDVYCPHCGVRNK